MDAPYGGSVIRRDKRCTLILSVFAHSRFLALVALFRPVGDFRLGQLGVGMPGLGGRGAGALREGDRRGAQHGCSGSGTGRRDVARRQVNIHGP